MLDIKWIINNPIEADKAFKKRGLEPLANKLIKMSKFRSEVFVKLENFLKQRNVLSKEIPSTKDVSKKKELIKKVKLLKNDIAKLQDGKTSKNSVLDNFLMELPNFLDDTVPIGKNEKDNVEIRKFGNIKKFDFEIKDHVDLGEELDVLDFKTASKVSGSRFVYIKNNLAKLERALASYMIDSNIKFGNFTEIYTPLLVNEDALKGTGQLPKFDSDIFKTRENLWLIPTSEVTLVNLIRDQIINEDNLPLRYTSYTPCFRSEAGAAGKDTRGLKRQHQFGKVEIVSITSPDESEKEHQFLLNAAEKILQDLELPYRVCELCSGEVGFASKKTFDLEVWIPSTKNYMEISSISNCGDFQSRRINARYKKNDKNIYPHTLNGSSLAIGRSIIAILENYQNKDGSVNIPKVLKKYMNDLERL
jgi:seryl-tRNA synthetase